MSNILIVTPYFRPAKFGGGGQVSIENLVDILAEDHTITIICYNHDFGKNAKINNTHVIKENKIKIYYFSILNLIKILKEISKTTFDYIYFNSFFSTLCFLFQIYYFNKRKIVSPKGEFYDGAIEKKKIFKLFVIKAYHYLYNKTTFHSTSSHELDTIKKYFPFSKIKLARDVPSIQEKIDFEKYKIQNSENKIFKIIFSSRIEYKKNLSYIPQLLMNLEGLVQFDIYGEIADRIYFEDIINNLNNLPNNIQWNYFGSLNFKDARYIFFQYDLFLFPTFGENFGYVICESLQCGCPILLSKNTTPWDNLEDAGVGYNIDLKNTETWVEKIKTFQNMSIEDKIKVSKLCQSYINNKLEFNQIKKENKELFKSI